MHKFNWLKNSFLSLILLVFLTPAFSSVGNLKLDNPPDSILCVSHMHDILQLKEFKHVVTKNVIIEAICEAHVKHNIPYEILVSIMWTESRFIVKAKNGPNVGLMQINTRYHKNKNLNSIQGNIDYAAKYLKELIVLSGSINGGLSRYNGGSKNYVYISKINNAYRKFFTG